MGLYESIEKILTKNDGEITTDELFKALKKDYSQITILKFLEKIPQIFTITNGVVGMKDFKLNRFISDLIDFIRQEKINDPQLFKYLAELFLQNSKFGYKETVHQEGFFGISKNEHFRRKSLELFHSISQKDWDSPEFVYKLSVSFFSILVDQTLQGRMLYSTPDTLVDLILKFIPHKEKLKVYNPTSGLLKLITAVSVFSGSKIEAYASEINGEIYEFGTYLARSNKVHGFFEQNNSLEDWKWKNTKFDLILCNPPFNTKIDYFSRHEYPYDDLSLNIISNSMKQLNEDGIGIFLIPDNVLFGYNNEFLRFRRELVDSQMLRTIISLPTNLFAPVSSLKTSLLIIDKNWKNKKVQFLDASLKKYYQIQEDKSIELNINLIIDRIEPILVGDDKLVKEALVQYNSSDYVEILTADIAKNKYSLQIRNYISSSQNYDGEEYVTIDEILKTLKLYNATDKNVDFPFIRISELNNNIINSPEKLRFNTTRTNGKVLDREAILIGTIGGSHKPTLFDGSFLAELSNNIIALQPKKAENVFMPYLVQELNKKYVLDQMSNLSVGATTLRYLRKNDLLKVKVKFPDIEKQKQIYNSRLGFVSEEVVKAQKIETLTEEQVFGTIKHEIGNILRGPDGFLDLLPNFLNRNNIALDQPIVNAVGAETVGQMIEMSQRNIQQVYAVLENLKGVLFSEEKYFKPKQQEIRSYLKKKLESENFNGNIQWFISVNGEFDKPTNIFAEFDSIQFDYVLRNICLNAMNHGMKDEKLTLVINIRSLEDSIEIHFINNGEPFPSDFSIDDYVTFGKKQGKSKGSGLGGYVINQIVKNHHGTLEILPGGEPIELTVKNKSIKIDANVDILITIPKKQ